MDKLNGQYLTKARWELCDLIKWEMCGMLSPTTGPLFHWCRSCDQAIYGFCTSESKPQRLAQANFYFCTKLGHRSTLHGREKVADESRGYQCLLLPNVSCLVLHAFIGQPYVIFNSFTFRTLWTR